jgi:Spy/CpxP family protein refolding chaperone
MSHNVKLIGAATLVVVALGFFYVRYRNTKPAAEDLIPKATRTPAATASSEPRSVAPEKQPRLARPEDFFRPRPAPGSFQAGEGGPDAFRPPSPEERRRMREELFRTLDLTPEQRAKIEEIDKRFEGQRGPDVAGKRMRALSEVLTPEQRDQAFRFIRAQLHSRLQERIEMLPPDQRKKFLEKLDKHMEQRRQEVERGESPPGPPR